MGDIYERLNEVIEQATSSEEVAAKVLKKLAGSSKWALEGYLEHVLGAYQPMDDEHAAELVETIGKCVDDVLNAVVEKEILGGIPKEQV